MTDPFAKDTDTKTAVVGVVEHEGKVLMGKKVKIDHVFSGGWHIPSGKIQVGETAEEAVIREMKEEAGIDVKVKKLLDESFFAETGLLVKWYLCSPITRDIKPGEDLAEVKFVTKDEARKIAHPKAIFNWPQKVMEFFKS